MDKLSFMIAAIWACGLILIPHPGEGEMLTLTDAELGAHFFQGMTITQKTARPDNHIQPHAEELLEETVPKIIDRLMQEDVDLLILVPV